jgi:hypothetical protein
MSFMPSSLMTSGFPRQWCVSKSRGTGDAVTLAIETPLMRFERINKKLNKPNKKALDA